MNNDEEMLRFVKGKLEEGEGVSSDSLSRILAAAEAQTSRRPPVFFSPRIALAAASFAVAVCGWYLVDASAAAHRENDVANVIALLSAADGDDLDSGSSLSDALCAWQDAPTLASAD